MRPLTLRNLKAKITLLSLAFGLFFQSGMLNAAEPFAGTKADFHGAALTLVSLGNDSAKVIAPEKVAVGRPWVLAPALHSLEAPAFRNVTRTLLELVRRGFHVVAVPMERWEEVYNTMTTRHGLSEAVSLLALGDEGVAVGRWAVAHPGKVLAVYFDKAVCDIDSWKPAKTEGEQAGWKTIKPLYGFKSEAEVLALKDNFTERAVALAAQKVGIIYLSGEKDEEVPYAANGGVIEREYQRVKGDFLKIQRKGEGHQPYGQEDPTPVVDFFQKLVAAQSYEVFPGSTKIRQPIGTLELLPDGERPWLEVTEAEAAKIRAALPEKLQATPLKPRKLLVFYRTDFFAHNSIPHWNRLLELLSEKTGAFTVTFSQSYAELMPERIAQYDAVFFNNTCRMKTPEPVKASLQAFIKSGKGFVGNHGAGDNWHDWPEGAAMLEGEFVGHPFGRAQVKIDDAQNPINAVFAGQSFPVSDELYVFKSTLSRAKIRVLLSIDLAESPAIRERVEQFRSEPNNARFLNANNDYPMAWIRPWGQGRVFYCVFGHTPTMTMNAELVRFYLAGIQYALGDLRVDDAPVPTP